MIGPIVLGIYSILLGTLAQVWKRRTGAWWAIISLTVMLGGGVLLRRGIAERYTTEEMEQPRIRRSIATVSFGVPLVFMSLVVLSLPRIAGNATGGPYEAQRLRRKCPFCAEMILAEARVCRYCGHEVRPILEPEDIPTLPAGPPTPRPDRDPAPRGN